VSLPLPYALAAPVFPFRHLASLAGRAPIGGAREVALACFVAARLAADRGLGDVAIPPAARSARCAGAKAWLGTLALPAPVRSSAAQCVEMSAGGGTHDLARAMRDLSTASAPFLDPGSRAELDAVAAVLAAVREPA
jgi:hypothetical protein